MGAITSIFEVVPLDWFIVGGIIVVLSLDSLRSGIGRAAALAAALPLTLFAHSLLGSAAFVGNIGALAGGAYSEAITFGVIVVLAYLLVRRMGLEFIDGGIGQPIQAIIASVAVAVIFTVVWLETPALGALFQFGSQIQAVFSESFRLFWLLCAYAALAFARG